MTRRRQGAHRRLLAPDRGGALGRAHGWLMRHSATIAWFDVTSHDVSSLFSVRRWWTLPLAVRRGMTGGVGMSVAAAATCALAVVLWFQLLTPHH